MHTLRTSLGLSLTLIGALILTALALPTPTHAATCTDTYLSGSSVPTGYGAAYNLFSTAQELLVRTASCTDTSLSIKAGNDQATTLVYKEGYHWSGTAWIKYDLTSPDPLQYTYYYPKAAVANIPIPAGNTSKYYVAYLCQNINESWKCGCSNQTCATRAWQLQKVSKTVNTNSGPDCGNNICEAGETTATCAKDCPATTGGARGRVHVRNNIVLSDRNTPLRGATLQLTQAPATSQASWNAFHDMGLNAVRLDVKLSEIGKTLSQQLPRLDQAVDMAGKAKMYVMILNTVHPGNYNLQELKTFWGTVAARYKDRTHVFYEMVNEPVGWYPHNYTAQNMADLDSVYEIMRAAAPDTHIVLFDFPNLMPDSPASIVAKIASVPGIDWTKASVGYHHYIDTNNVGEATVKYVQARYPVLMTETNYWNPDTAAQKTSRTILRLYEKLGWGWFSLAGNDNTIHRLKNEIIPDLHSAGYQWAVEN